MLINTLTVSCLLGSSRIWASSNGISTRVLKSLNQAPQIGTPTGISSKVHTGKITVTNTGFSLGSKYETLFSNVTQISQRKCGFMYV